MPMQVYYEYKEPEKRLREYYENITFDIPKIMFYKLNGIKVLEFYELFRE